MTKLDDDRREFARRNQIPAIKYGCTFLAGVVIGILICIAMG